MVLARKDADKAPGSDPNVVAEGGESWPRWQFCVLSCSGVPDLHPGLAVNAAGGEDEVLCLLGADGAGKSTPGTIGGLKPLLDRDLISESAIFVRPAGCQITP